MWFLEVRCGPPEMCVFVYIYLFIYIYIVWLIAMIFMLEWSGVIFVYLHVYWSVAGLEMRTICHCGVCVLTVLFLCPAMSV
jgi:hypothetical protein